MDNFDISSNSLYYILYAAGNMLGFLKNLFNYKTQKTDEV